MIEGQSRKVGLSTRNAMRTYYVDEAGDGTLFDAKGRVIAGAEGCSNYFILGMLDIAAPEALAQEMEVLRCKLLDDPYFRGVPSMQPGARKTALAFHAKDDVAEVRREVFALLLRQDLGFYAVVRNKHKVIEYVRQRNEQESGYRYQPNDLYDYMVRRLFRSLLHKDDSYSIYFSKRGKQDRTAALQLALEQTREQFSRTSGIQSTAPIKVLPRAPGDCPGLQTVDYFLWALQRLCERREDRYVEYLRPAFRMVHDLDDTRQSRHGVYYTKKRPLIAAALEELPGI
jgi:hypothetical protein